MRTVEFVRGPLEKDIRFLKIKMKKKLWSVLFNEFYTIRIQISQSFKIKKFMIHTIEG